MSKLLRLLVWTLLIASAITSAYEISSCLDSYGGDMGCSCAYTALGVSCPANYYCPEYSAADIKTYNSSLLAKSCKIDSTGTKVQCPCTPGFYCPANTSQPVYCCKGYYCPSDGSDPMIDPATQELNENGLGTWGAKAFICPDKKFCVNGQVEPFDCPALGKCPEGSDMADKKGMWAVLIVVIIAICICFYILEFKRERARQLQKLMFQSQPQNNASGSGASEKAASNPLQTAGGAGDMRAPISGEDRQSFLIEFEDIGLTLKTGTTIMQGVCGKFSPGRLCAIMGPSGAGKTTIISLVTGKAEKTAGTVKINGSEEEGLTKYQKLVGFVPQEDVMIRSLSVRDNIAFSARYRLPASLSDSEITRKVNECIEVLGVSHVQHSPIGDERTRGVSGGQRKRVNIGIELVTDPSVLFLDEPTSGLDSTTATALCSTLKSIAQSKKMTIAAVIHQPSLSSFLEFDDLLLLGKGGRVVYAGPVNDAPKYFNDLGFPLPANCNPADHYLDLCQGAVPRKGHPEFDWPHLFDLWEEHRLQKPTSRQHSIAMQQAIAIATDKDTDAGGKLKAFVEAAKEALLHIYYGIEDYWVTFFKDLNAFFRDFGKPDPIRVTPGIRKQFRLCLERSLKQVFTTPREFILQLLVHLGIGILISQSASKLEYLGPYPDPICNITPVPFRSDCFLPGLDNYKNTANFMCFGVLFASIATASASFGSEQVNYWRECAAGLHSVPYFVGKFIANFPLLLGASFFFYIAFEVTFQNTATSNQIFAIILALYWFGFSIGYVVSQCVSPQYAGMCGVLIALIFAVGLSGVNPSLTDVEEKPKGAQIFWYVSGPRWVLEAFYVSQVKYYNEIPDGSLYAGQPYINVHSGLDNNAYSINAFKTDIRALFLCGFGWSMVALYLMITSYKDKKK